MSEFMTTAELAVHFRVSVSAITKWWHRGILPAPVLPSPRRPRWRVTDIEK